MKNKEKICSRFSKIIGVALILVLFATSTFGQNDRRVITGTLIDAKTG